MGDKARDNTKVERTVFIICVLAFLAVGLFTYYYDVPLLPFFIVTIIDIAIFVTWYVTSDRF